MFSTHITDYLKLNTEKYPAELAIVIDKQQLTWSELQGSITAVASYISSSVGERNSQQVICFCMPNSLEFVITYLSILEAGHIAMPLDVIYKPLETKAIIKQVSPALLIVDEANAKRLRDDVEYEVYNEIPKTAVAYKPLRLAADEQIASLVFTSGTTGKPKLAPYTHSNHIWNIEVCSRVWEWEHSDAYLMSLRLSHWYGLCLGITGWLYHGSTFYLQDGFDAKKTLETLAAGNIRLFSHTPLAYAKMLEVEGDYDLSKVRLCISGSAPLPPAVWQNFKDRFGLEIVECYGSSETGRIAANHLDDRRPGSPGQILPDVEIHFNKAKQLLVKSPGLFPGYFNNPDETAKNINPDGYWNTGDIAELVENRLILKGRSQETIRKMSYTISPRDIEWALMNAPGIKECAVISGESKDANGDDIIYYFIVGDISEENLRQYTKTDLPSVWRADEIKFLPILPRTANGKVSLPDLRAMIN